MTDGMARRIFLTQMSLGLCVAALGGSLAWWGSASAAPPQRKTPSGDLLETVPQGELPSFARTGGPTSRVAHPEDGMWSLKRSRALRRCLREAGSDGSMDVGGGRRI